LPPLVVDPAGLAAVDHLTSISRFANWTVLSTAAVRAESGTFRAVTAIFFWLSRSASALIVCVVFLYSGEAVRPDNSEGSLQG
jgi:hypothetical protein